MSMLPNCIIPGYLIEEILPKLPIKSLLRFRSISKPWYSLLTNPSFIHMHLQLHQTNTLLLTKMDKHHPRSGYSNAFYVYNRDSNTFYQLPLWLFPFERNTTASILGTSNGLVCIQGNIDGPTLILWNPATRNFKYLDSAPGTWSESILISWFGFVPDTNDYKIILIHSRNVYVYTVSSDSWRIIGIVAPVSCHYARGAVTLDGVIYWTYYDLQSDRMYIFSFDLRDEVYGMMKVPLPDSWHVLEIESKLVVLKGSLSLIYYEKWGKNRRFEIWVLTELGVEESWTKLCIAGPFYGEAEPDGEAEPVGSWKDGQIIFKFIQSKSKMLSYDPYSRETKYFSVRVGGYLSGAFNYVESLESVDRCTSGRGYSRIHVQNEDPVDLDDCSDDFVWTFAIPGPKGSSLLHCRLCGEFFSGIDRLKLHLAHRGSPYIFPLCPPCRYVSDYVKKQVEMYLPLSN